MATETKSKALAAPIVTASSQSITPTQRAYTLRLRPAIREGDDPAQKSRELHDALWATHEAINHGARAFGNWLLTLRGGLEHTLADVAVRIGIGKPDRAPTTAERRDRRVLLALSWLSVEDERGAPKKPGLIVAYGDDCKSQRDSQDGRDRKVVDALRVILQRRGLTATTIDEWVDDCERSLKARIRDDAVWVNRSAAFDLLATSWRNLTRTNSQAVLEEFFGMAVEWIGLPAQAIKGEDDETSETTGSSVSGGGGDGKEFRTIARSFLSVNFGTGGKTDKRGLSAALTQAAGAVATLAVSSAGSAALSHLCEEFGVSGADDDARYKSLRQRIGWKTGAPSKGQVALSSAFQKARLSTEDIALLIQKLKEEAATKHAGAAKSVPTWITDLGAELQAALGFGFVTERNLLGEFGVMLDHAARRVSIACSWIKLAELERRQFETDAMKLDAVREQHPAAVAFLDALGRKRAGESGTADGTAVLIRKRAIMGWKDVVAAWSRGSVSTVQARIDAMRLLQGDLEKFGDSKLFEELAAEEACVVWRNADGISDPTILERYSAGCVAESNQQRFKVPAYRHPDPLRHPVFGDFGTSRFEIEFALHERVQATASGKPAKKSNADWHADPRNMRMGLWTGARIEKVQLRWSSKRLESDLSLKESQSAPSIVVTRADRLGRACAAANKPVHVASVFEEENWNGRLQAPRAELDKIARLSEKGNAVQARKLRDRISWLVSFSPKLMPSGPFIAYAAANGIAPNKKSGEYWPNSDINKARKGHHAKLIYARLPSLRVLSVDLGHRFAAACAVWEAMSNPQLEAEASKGKVVRGGLTADALFAHIETKGLDGKQRITICRRIGSDKLPDGSIHPAPWAKLERQFLIKLQGEELPPRMAAPDEQTLIAHWENSFGIQSSGEASGKPIKDVAELMARAVRVFTLAGRRHFDRARIAHNLRAEHRTRPGGISEPLTEESRIDLLTDTLALWHGLFAGDRWSDPMAQHAWSESGLPALVLPGRGDDDEASFGGPGRKAAIEAYHATLRPHAARLAKSDLSKLATRWIDRWTQDDRQWAGKEGLLRSLRKWITPRGLRIQKSDSLAVKDRKSAAALRARHVGGLSMQRINTLTGLYRLLKSFKNRPEPDDLRKNIPAKGDDRLVGFNRRLLEVRDRLREQRVKQLASRITEAALGIGRITSRQIANGAARPTWRVDATCHAVVIESLSNYRPDELQTRRENRQLMEWASAKVQKYLAESCQLHGLHLREVQPNYTSRQCSRTGVPGLRAVSVTAHDLLTTIWWKRDVARSKANIKKAVKDGRGGAAMDQLLINAEQWALRIPERDRQNRKADSAGATFNASRIILPRKGGDLFVSESAQKSNAGHIPGLQADLNAAANIGVRALLDPDWAGKWWWVPCTGGTFVPSPEKTSGAMVFSAVDELPQVVVPIAAPPQAESGLKRVKSPRAKKAEVREIENRWRACSTQPLSQGHWVSSGEYWSKVEAAICRVLEGQFS